MIVAHKVNYHHTTLYGVKNTLLSTQIIWNLVIFEDVKQL